MALKCDHCGEFAVDDSEGQGVCHACGIVVDGIQFSSAPDFIRPAATSTYIPGNKYQSRLSRKKKDPVTLTHGLNVLDNLCQVNNIPSHWKTEISSLLKLITSVRRFKNKEDAGVTTACCLFLLQRNNQQTIPINSLCQQVQCTKKKFSYYLKLLKSSLKTDDRFKEYSSLLENGHDKTDVEMSDAVQSFIREVCDKVRPEEKSQLIKKTSDLVKLASSCWLLTGRSPRGLVTASAYLCWKSMTPLRKKASFSKFCRDFEITESTARIRLHELQGLLVDLGEKLPSYGESRVNEKNYIYYLDTILEHSEILRNDLFPDKYTKVEIDASEYSTFRIPPVSIPRSKPTSGLMYDSDINASDIEISDSEIESYIVPDGKKNVDDAIKKLRDLQ